MGDLRIGVIRRHHPGGSWVLLKQGCHPSPRSQRAQCAGHGAQHRLGVEWGPGELLRDLEHGSVAVARVGKPVVGQDPGHVGQRRHHVADDACAGRDRDGIDLDPDLSAGGPDHVGHHPPLRLPAAYGGENRVQVLGVGPPRGIGHHPFGIRSPRTDQFLRCRTEDVDGGLVGFE